MNKKEIDKYSYDLGVIDCFCEMVAAGLKTMALSHPCDTREERDSYLADVEELCGKYAIKYYAEDDPFLTDLFPAELSQGKCYFIFFLTDDVLERYLALKREQAQLIRDGAYRGEKRRQIARDYGRLLSYPEDGIDRLLQKTAKKG